MTHQTLRVRFLKKIQDWILKSEIIRKRILRFFTQQINPRSFGSRCLKGAEESTLGVDSSVPLIHHDPRDLGLICLVKKRKIRFRILSEFKNPILDFFKETHPKSWKVLETVSSHPKYYDEASKREVINVMPLSHCWFCGVFSDLSIGGADNRSCFKAWMKWSKKEEHSNAFLISFSFFFFNLFFSLFPRPPMFPSASRGEHWRRSRRNKTHCFPWRQSSIKCFLINNFLK